MISVDLSTRECDGHVVVALRGELDMADAVTSGRESRPRRRGMIWAGSSMSRPRDNGYRSDGAQHATGEVAQDRRAPGAPLGACNQVPGTVTRDRPATLALRATETPLTGRFAGPGMSDPAQRGVRRGKCRSPPVTGVPADPVWQAATRPLRFDLLNVQIFSPRPQDGG